MVAIKVTVLVVAALALAGCSSPADAGKLNSKLRTIAKRSPQVVLEPASIAESIIVPGCRTLPFPYVNYCSYKQCWRLPNSYQLVCYAANHLPYPAAGILGPLQLSEQDEHGEEEKPANLELNESEQPAAKVEAEVEAGPEERRLSKRSAQEETQDETQDETNSIVIIPGCRSLPFPYINYCSLRQCWRLPFTYRVVCRNAISGLILNESAEQSESAGEEK